MLHAQIPLPLPRPKRLRARSLRRPFMPSSALGPYRLPREVHDRLTVALQPYRNREAAYALAVYLARYWSAPDRIDDGFAVDRRALSGGDGLDLSEARVRGAARVLDEVGFLDRRESKGSPYKPTVDGLRRKPVFYSLGAEYRPLFERANQRAAVARGKASRQASPIPSEIVRRPVRPVSQPLISPKYKSEEYPSIYLGEVVKPLPSPSDSNPKLEAALDRLLQGIRQSRSFDGT